MLFCMVGFISCVGLKFVAVMASLLHPLVYFVLDLFKWSFSAVLMLLIRYFCNQSTCSLRLLVQWFFLRDDCNNPPLHRFSACYSHGSRWAALCTSKQLVQMIKCVGQMCTPHYPHNNSLLVHVLGQICTKPNMQWYTYVPLCLSKTHLMVHVCTNT